jgi:hypothetical protein
MAPGVSVGCELRTGSRSGSELAALSSWPPAIAHASCSCSDVALTWSDSGHAARWNEDEEPSASVDRSRLSGGGLARK